MSKNVHNHDKINIENDEISPNFLPKTKKLMHPTVPTNDDKIFMEQFFP